MNSMLVWLGKFKQKNAVELIKLFLFFFVIFTCSINLFYKISLEGAYVRGLLVDYLIPKIYLVELFLIPFLVMELKQLQKIKVNIYLCFLVLVLLGRQLLSQSPLAAFVHLVHVTELVLFFSVVRLDPLFKDKIAEKFGVGAMLSAIIFQSLLAIYQFIFQKSLLAYKFLGETNLMDLTNISKAQFFFSERILPYGATPHPNILAGVVVILSMLVINKIKNFKLIQLLLIGNALLIIFLTQSISALLTLGLFLFYQILNKFNKKIKIKKLLIVLLFYLFLILLPYLLGRFATISTRQNSVDRRVILNQASLEMFKHQMLFGVGINNFTLNLETYSTNQETVRFIQPVHHLLFLTLSEGGLLLLIIFFLLIKQSNIKNFYTKSIILLALAGLDHYLFTQFSGMSLLVLFYLFL